MMQPPMQPPPAATLFMASDELLPVLEYVVALVRTHHARLGYAAVSQVCR